MRRLLIFCSVLFLGPSAYALDVWKSSNTVTADAGGVLCGGGKRGFFHGVCVNTTATSGLTVYNSSFTATGVESFGLRNLNTQGCHYYDVLANKGLFYVKTGTADATILYECY